jgi:hypothetical protein
LRTLFSKQFNNLENIDDVIFEMNPRMKKTDEVILKIDMDERKLMVLF